MPSDVSLAPPLSVDVAIVGAGPAGLMAAEVLAQAGVTVHVWDASASVGRKFLLAGKGGLNLTHSEPAAQFHTRYGARQAVLQPILEDFDAPALRAWAAALGVETFVGSSGRVFPVDMKAAPLLRAWLHRLRHPDAAGAVPVQFHMRHRCVGWDAQGHLCLESPQGTVRVQARVTVLALGGGSWARLGSDGAWVPWLAQQGVDVAPLQPANCGFDVAPTWSDWFVSRYAGQPFKSVAIEVAQPDGSVWRRKGEFVATATGVEGSVVYAASALLRDAIGQHGNATLLLDLLPDVPQAKVEAEIRHPRGSRSLSSHLKSRLRLDGIKSAVLHELLPAAVFQDPAALAAAIKALPIVLQRTRPLDEAISTAGGVRWEALDDTLMLRCKPGVFCAGEMLDWEAPTGGYLLQASFATGVRAAQGVLRHLRSSA